MTLINVATALVAEQLKQAAVQQMKDLAVLTKLLPSNFLPALVQDALQVVRNAGDDRLLFATVKEVDRFLVLAARELKDAPPVSASDLPGPNPNPSAYRIFRRLLTYRQAALYRATVATLRVDLGGAQ